MLTFFCPVLLKLLPGSWAKYTYANPAYFIKKEAFFRRGRADRSKHGKGFAWTYFCANAPYHGAYTRASA